MIFSEEHNTSIRKSKYRTFVQCNPGSDAIVCIYCLWERV